MPTSSNITKPWIEPHRISAIRRGAGEQPGIDAARHLGDEAVERLVRDLVAGVRRHEARDRAAEHDHVVGRVGQRRVAVAGGATAEVDERVVGLRRWLIASQALEALDVELVDDAVLPAEAAVEPHRGAARLGGDAPHGERGSAPSSDSSSLAASRMRRPCSSSVRATSLSLSHCAGSPLAPNPT